jgi:hypothetical protein
LRLLCSDKRIGACRLAALGICVLLAIAHTWPLASRPAVYSRVDNGDYSLNVWALDWVAHGLISDPVHLFDANIFYPARHTLAYSEPLILQGALAIPGALLRMSPVATLNLVLIAGFALTAWAFALLVHRDTGSWVAGLVAGSAVAFNAHNLVRLAHIQALHLELLPLPFFALDRLFVTGRRRYAALLGASVALQATASIYLLVFTAWAVVAATIARVPEWRHRLRETTMWTLVASATCALLLLPILWPYAELARSEGLVRNFAETRRCSATWNDYLYTGSRVHFDLWSERFRESSSDANFPGVIVTGMAVLGLIGTGSRSPRARMWLGVIVGSVLLSMLPRAPGFAWLHEHLPVFGALRCYSRAGQIALVGMGVLAGYGTARLMAATTTVRAATLAGIALVAGVNLEAMRAPFWYSDFAGIPPIYDRLRDEPHAVVVEVPFYDRRAFFRNADYMINATRHRHPIVNGYSGFAPRRFDVTAQAMKQFPELASLEMMHRLGVTHVVVHLTEGMEDRRAAIDASPSLRLMAAESDIAIYRFVH